MKQSFNILMPLWILSAAMGFGALPEIPDTDTGAGLWKSKRQGAIESLLPQQNEVRIPQLGEMLRQLETLNYRDRPEKSEIVELLQRSLTSIPGHAEYYRDRILDAQKLFKTHNDGPSYVDYRKEQRYAFQTLPHMPSPETVRVYGELLYNDWVPPGNETALASEKLSPLSESATAGLLKLPIQNKPFKDSLTQGNAADAHAAWLQWFEEIKSGKRTFRFEGDPTEYDLHGPAPKQKLDRIARDVRRDAERAVGRNNRPEPASEGATAPAEETPSKTAAIATAAAGLVLLGSLVWYFARSGKRKAR